MVPFRKSKGKNAVARPNVAGLNRVFPIARHKLEGLVDEKLPDHYRLQLHHELLFLKAVVKISQHLLLNGKELTLGAVLADGQVRKKIENLWADTKVRKAKRILLPLRYAETSPLRPLVVEIIKNFDMVVEGAKPNEIEIEFVGIDGVPVKAEKFNDLPTETEAMLRIPEPQLEA